MENIKILINTLILAARADTPISITSDTVVRVLNGHVSRETEADLQKAYEELICALRQDQTEGLKLATPVVDKQISQLVEEYGKACMIRGTADSSTVRLAHAALLSAISRQGTEPPVDAKDSQERVMDALSDRPAPCVDAAFSELVTALMVATRRDERHATRSNLADLTTARDRVIVRYNELAKHPDLQEQPENANKAFDDLLDTALADRVTWDIMAASPTAMAGPVKAAERRAAASRDAVRARYAGLDRVDLMKLVDDVSVAAEACGFIRATGYDTRAKTEALDKAKAALLKAVGKVAISWQDLCRNTISADKIVVGVGSLSSEPVVPRRDPEPYTNSFSKLLMGQQILAIATNPQTAIALRQLLNAATTIPVLRAKAQALIVAAQPFEEVHNRHANDQGTLPGGEVAMKILRDLVHAVQDLKGAVK